MDIFLDQKPLVTALTAIGPAVSKYSTLPILSNVEIVADSSGVRFATCDLESYAEYVVRDADVSQEGRTTVSYKELITLVKKLRGQRIRLASGDGYNEGSLVVTGEQGSSAHLQTDDKTDFPRGAHQAIDETIGTVSLGRERFVRMVEFVAPSAATDDSRPVLMAVNCELVNGTFIMATADAFRLAVARELTLPKESWNRNPLIPAKALAAFAYLLPGKKDSNAEVTLSYSESHATISSGPMTVDIRLIDGRWPNWRYVVSTTQDPSTTVVAPVDEWLWSLNYVKKEAKESAWITVWEMKEAVSVKATRDEEGAHGISTEVRGAQKSGKDLEILFNHQYLTQAITRFPHAVVEVAMTTKHKPARVTYNGVGVDNPMSNYLAIVMPMQVNDRR